MAADPEAHATSDSRLDSTTGGVAAALWEPRLNPAERASAAILLAGGVGLALARLLRRSGVVPPFVYGMLGVSALYSAFGAARSEVMRQRRLMRQQSAT